MFKRSAAVLLAAVAAIIALAAPSHASPVSGYAYASLPLSGVKHDVQADLGAEGHRTLAWSDNGAWIQKSYRGVPVPDRWQGTETKAVLDYRWTPGVGWMLEFKTWCVWDNLNTWDCS